MTFRKFNMVRGWNIPVYGITGISKRGWYIPVLRNKTDKKI